MRSPSALTRGAGRADGLESRAAIASPVYPGAAWQHITDPASVGYCRAGLNAATARAKTWAHKTRQGQASVSRPEYRSLVDAVIAAKCAK